MTEKDVLREEVIPGKYYNTIVKEVVVTTFTGKAKKEVKIKDQGEKGAAVTTNASFEGAVKKRKRMAGNN